MFQPEGVQGAKPKGYDPITDPRTKEECEQAVKRKYCSKCPVTSECFEYSISVGQKFGVFGNTTEKERKSLVRS
jgi:hypothetical protein